MSPLGPAPLVGRVGAGVVTYRPESDHDKGDATQQPNPATLTDQNIGDDGHPEGSQRRIDRIAGRNPEARDEAATPAARERATKDQEKDRPWRRRNWEADQKPEGQCAGHRRSQHQPAGTYGILTLAITCC